MASSSNFAYAEAHTARPSGRDHLLTYGWAIVLAIVLALVFIAYVMAPAIYRPAMPSSAIVNPVFTTVTTTSIRPLALPSIGHGG